MNFPSNRGAAKAKTAVFLSLGGLLATGYLVQGIASAQADQKRFAGPTSSQPLALSADGRLLAVANPDNDTVSIFDVQNDHNRRLAEVKVQSEPNGVVVSPDGSHAYVANTASGTVSVLKINPDKETVARVVKHIPVGTEPYGIAITPNGEKVYVTNARSNSVSVISTKNNRVIKTIQNAGFEPRGIAITNNGDGTDDDETVYISQFLAIPVAGKLDGFDDAKSGLVTVIAAADDTVKATVILQPLADTGFKSAGDALARTAAPANPAPEDFKFVTGAYPNQLNNIAIKGNFAFIPATGASPNGPTRFDVNTQSLLAVFNRKTNQDAGTSINMHTAVKAQTNASKLFISVPWAMAFKNASDEGYVVSAASNIVVKIKVDPATGQAAVQKDLDPTRVLQLRVGKNPRGIVVNANDTRAYVMNYISRDVTVLDLTLQQEQVMATMASAGLPVASTFEDKIHVGKELFNTSVGEFDAPGAGKPPITGRMSNNGWGACSACHPFGLSDNVVWIFAGGPRRTISLHTDFDPGDPLRKSQRALNWSAERDEEEDFELNIRNVSGGAGLLVAADGITADNPVVALAGTANGGRRQLKVRGAGAWDAIKAYLQFGIRSPISPVSKYDPDVIEGAKLFESAKCQSCHGGTQWTSSRIGFTAPPDAASVINTQLADQLKKVGTFDPIVKNEVRATGATALGADGFVPPSLLSLFAFPRTFLHNGSADSLDQVMQSAVHRSAGTSGVDTLADDAQRTKLVKFLLSIDDSTPPIQP